MSKCDCRIIDWFGLKGTFRIIQFQPHAVSRDPFNWIRLLKLHPTDLERFQGWDNR